MMKISIKLVADFFAILDFLSLRKIMKTFGKTLLTTLIISSLCVLPTEAVAKRSGGYRSSHSSSYKRVASYPVKRNTYGSKKTQSSKTNTRSNQFNNTQKDATFSSAKTTSSAKKPDSSNMKSHLLTGAAGAAAGYLLGKTISDASETPASHAQNTAYQGSSASGAVENEMTFATPVDKVESALMEIKDATQELLEAGKITETQADNITLYRQKILDILAGEK